jgi:hypothetical protein
MDRYRLEQIRRRRGAAPGGKQRREVSVKTWPVCGFPICDSLCLFITDQRSKVMPDSRPETQSGPNTPSPNMSASAGMAQY